MQKSSLNQYQPWPALPYDDFAATGYFLHRLLQVIGKLKLATPFEPQWANVSLPVTSRGLSTGLIPYKKGAFSVDVDCINHEIICTSSWGRISKFALAPMSVAQFTVAMFDALRNIEIETEINLMPQEVENPIAFDNDVALRPYEFELVNAWWRILVSSQLVMEHYHARFTGKTPAIGLMWGTLDLRDARYNGTRVATTGQNAEYIRRNAMNEAQVEVGWWSGNPVYPRPAYFSFIYPQPANVEQAKIEPASAHWEKTLGEFILDYDDVRNSQNPEKDLLSFFESTYSAEAKFAGWESKLIGPGKAE
jgi:hypothetical protein